MLFMEKKTHQRTQLYLMYLRDARSPQAIRADHEEGLDIEHDCNPANDAAVKTINSCVENNKTCK